MLFKATQTDRENIMPSELSQIEEDKCYMIIYIWYLKNNTNEFMYKTKTDSQTQKANIWFQRREGEEEGQVGSLVQTTIGEGNGNPLQYSCLGNPTDGGAWRAIIRGFAKSQTRLSA